MVKKGKVKKKEFAVHLPPALHRKLKLRASLDGLSISGAVEKLAEEYTRDLGEVLQAMANKHK